MSQVLQLKRVNVFNHHFLRPDFVAATTKKGYSCLLGQVAGISSPVLFYMLYTALAAAVVVHSVNSFKLKKKIN